MGHRGHNLMLNIVNRIVSLFKCMHCIPWSIWCDRRKPCENHKVISSMAIKIILSLATFSGGKRMRIQMKKEAWVLLKFCIWIHLPNVGSPVVAGPVPCLDKMSLLRMQLTQLLAPTLLAFEFAVEWHCSASHSWKQILRNVQEHTRVFSVVRLLVYKLRK